MEGLQAHQIKTKFTRTFHKTLKFTWKTDQTKSLFNSNGGEVGKDGNIQGLDMNKQT